MDKEFFKKCWKNPRWHSLMVLIIWIVSLSLLMGVVTIINEFKPQEKRENYKIEETQKGISYKEKLQDLLSDEYLMSFIVTKNDNTIKYEGTEYNEVVNGYKEDASGITKYRIENGILYEVILDQVTEIESIYEEIISEFLDRNTLIAYILENEEEGIIDNKETSTYEYNLRYKEEKISINVVETKEFIEQITIENENENYQLTFSKNKN